MSEQHPQDQKHAKPHIEAQSEQETETLLLPKTPTVVPEAEWQVGEVVMDLYEIKDIHTSGGMGFVYRAHHRNWNIDLAIKSPRKDFFKTEQQKEDFTHECETWIDLGLHPHIVSCFYVRRIDDTPRVFAEYVEGWSLHDWIYGRDNKPPRLYQGSQEEILERILDIAIQFAWGLQYAHEKGLVHQDVKPLNVMMMPDGTAKVTDFGLARARVAAGETEASPDAQQSTLASSGGMTRAYCSPEQANREKLTRRTDIWSWAVSILELFTGEVAWASGSAAGYSFEKYYNERRFKIPMPEPFTELLRKCFQQKPENRTEDMAGIASVLKETYQQTTRQNYYREEPKAAELLADSLNNHAISFIDLGQHEQAEKLFDEILRGDPYHPEAIYNHGLFLWRLGRITDDVLVKQFDNLYASRSNEWRFGYFLGLIHIERGDADEAVKVLEQVLRVIPTEPETQQALTIARAGLGKWRSCVRTFILRHTDSVNTISISPNGRWVISGSNEGSLELCELATGHCVRTFKGHTHWVKSVCFSPDGRWVLSGSGDKTLKLWELDIGTCVRTFEGHTGWVNSVCFSPDGRWALSGSSDRTLKLWELATGECVCTFKGHTNDVISVSISPDGCYALSKSTNKMLKLWELATSQCKHTFEGHTDDITSICFSSDWRWVLSGSKDTMLRLWKVSTGECVNIFEGHPGPVYSVSISPDGRWAMSGGGCSENKTLKDYDFTADYKSRLWDLATGQCVSTFEGHTDDVMFVKITPDGCWAISGSKDNTLRLWDLATGQCVRTFVEGIINKGWLVCVSPDGHRILSAARYWGDNTLRLWELRGGFPGHYVITLPRSAREVSELTTLVNTVIENAKTALKQGLITVAAKEIIKGRQLPGYEKYRELLDVWREIGKRGRCVGFWDGWSERQFEGPYGGGSCSISPDGRWAFLGGGFESSCTVQLWELATGQCIRTFEGHTGRVTSVCFSPDRYYGLSGSWDKTLKLWELATNQCVRTFEGHTNRVTSVCFSPDGRWVLSESLDNTVKLWELATGNCVRTFGVPTKAVTEKQSLIRMFDTSSCCFSPDGRWVFSQGKLWELATGECLRTFKRTATPSYFSPDGRWILSGGKLWELATGECVRTFKGTGRSGCFSPDGRWVLSLGKACLMVWNVATGQCVYTLKWQREDSRQLFESVSFSSDGRWGLRWEMYGAARRYCHFSTELQLWEFVWNYEFPELADWDEGARPYLEIFLTLHCPYGENGITRVGKPVWNDEDFAKLLKDLQYRGYGWLRPEGVRRELERMTREWEGPPSLPGEDSTTKIFVQVNEPEPRDSSKPDRKSWFSRLFGRK